MSRIGLAILVLIFAGTAFMIGFLAYNFAIIYNPVHYPKAAPLLSNIQTSTSTVTSTTSTTTSSTSTSTLPSGAVALPYDASNHTVFLYIVSLSTGNPFNFNGTSNGQLHIYIPAGWTVIVYYTNQESIPHNFNILQNDTATPNNANILADGKFLLNVGTTSSTYETQGISSGASASGSVVVPAGIYWIVCGIAGHAEAGMWGVLIASTSVTVPYAIS
ncbi:sulfocyanin [Acidianus sulfidivorans JP7]|uniref:Sulfocyanin n=1 Tax=Acidianus sulfidivorans JP7 TaxID=619593 RepID=A0A2U9IL87_9CREN|nr:sulfocyanin [Acidianus sulfidivorans]AWR96786.1 sulfocyanin [Acidianus sulfidivorans JP7]